MTDIYSKFPIISSNMLNIENLLNYLEEFNDILYFPTDNENLDSDGLYFKIIPNKIVEIKKIKSEDIKKLLFNLKVSVTPAETLLAILNVLKNNDKLLVSIEVLTHGLSYFDAVENLKKVIKYIEDLLINNLDFNDTNKICDRKIIQVMISEFKLIYLVSLMINNIDNVLVFTPIKTGRSVLSCLILITLLQKENPLLINQICFLLPDELLINCEITICSYNLIVDNLPLIKENQNFNIEFVEKSSCFLIMNDCDLFSAASNYLQSFGNCIHESDIPKLCLIQECVYDKFLSIINLQLKKYGKQSLLDLNRQFSLNFINNFDLILDLFNNSNNIKILSSIESCNDTKDFYLPFIIDQVQPQQHIFYDNLTNKLCSFLITFRTCEEAIMLANKLYRHKACAYLWTENISKCFEIKSHLNYDEICVNTINKPTLQPCYKTICNRSFFIQQSLESNLSYSEINLAIESFKSKSEIKSFIHRYKRVNSIISDIYTRNLLNKTKSDNINNYFENIFKKFQSYYLSKGDIHTIGEYQPMGCVVICVGGVDVNDDVIRLILLAWLFGNNVLVISLKQNINIINSIIEFNKMKSLMILYGSTSIMDLSNCPIDSVISLDNINNNIKYDNIHFMFLYKSIGMINNFDDVFPFVCKNRRMHVIAGGIGTK